MSGGTIRINDSNNVPLCTTSYYGGTSYIEIYVKGEKLHIEISENSSYGMPHMNTIYGQSGDLTSALAPLMSKITELLGVVTTEREMYRVRAEEWEKIAREREKNDDNTKQNS